MDRLVCCIVQWSKDHSVFIIIFKLKLSMNFFLSIHQNHFPIVSEHKTCPFNIIYTQSLAVNSSPGLPHNQTLCKLKKEPIGSGKWTLDEQKAYIQFLRDNMQEMQTKFFRKSRKVFQKMSRFVKTRDANQCRSHHQKILIFRGTLEQIIHFYEQRHKDKLGQEIIKIQAKASINDSQQDQKIARVPFSIRIDRDQIKITIEDSLIPAFEIC